MPLATGGEGWYLTDEEWMIKQTMREFVEAEVAPRFRENWTEETADPYYREVMKRCGELGFLRLAVDEKLGGEGMRFTTLLLAVEEMTRGCGALGIHVLENPLLGSQMAYACPKAWDEVGEGILDGSVIFASSMTQPEGNGNMAAWPIIGKKVDGGWLLNGEKAFCSGGTFADYLTVTGFGEVNGKPAMCKWAMSPDKEGLTIHHNPEIGNSPTYASLTLDNVFIPDGYGGVSINPAAKEDPAVAAIGYKAFAIGCAALSLGCMSAAYDEAVEYARNRDSFGKKVLEYGAIQKKLVDMKIKIESSRSLTYTAARMLETGHKDTAAWADMCKILSSQNAVAVTAEAVELFGTLGVNPEHGIMRHHLDSFGYYIGVGTPDLHYPSAGEFLGFPKSDDPSRS